MSRLPPLPQIETRDAQNAVIERCIRERARSGEPLQILEAGCGRAWVLALEGVAYTLTGVDTDAKALAERKDVIRDLDVAIEGDLRDVDLPAASFDVIYSAFVLEHIREAERVLENFARWLRPGGLLVLQIPDPNSARGFATRATPHWVHVAYYRIVMGYEWAGKPGYGPYETFYTPVVSRWGIRRWAERHHFGLLSENGDGHQNYGRGAKAWINLALVRGIETLSLGTLASGHANLCFVLEKARP